MKKAKLLIVPALMLTTFACSTAVVRVMPGENGENTIIAKDREQDGAEEAANKAAHEYCEKKGKDAVFVKNASKYNGSMDEGTRKAVRNASKVAWGLGGVGQQAGNIGHGMTNDRDYESKVVFKCK